MGQSLHIIDVRGVSACPPIATGSPRCGNRRFGSWLCENSKTKFARRNFVSSFVNFKTNSAGDRCRKKTIEKTILRLPGALAFLHSLGHSLHFSGVRRKSALHPTATKSLRRNERRFGPKAMTPVAHSPNTNLAFPQFPIVRCNSRVAFAGRFAQSFHVQDFNIASTVSNKAGLPQRICGE